MPIFKRQSLEESFSLIEEGTLVAMDLDNTLVESKSQFGSYQWGTHLMEQSMKEGLDFSRALELLIPRWEGVQDRIDLVPVEKDSSHRLRHWQEKGIPFLGITGRSPFVAELTIEQLSKNDFRFEPLSFTKDPFISYEKRVIYHGGVVFVGPFQCKGEVLKKIYEHLDKKIRRILLIDDQINYLVNAEKALRDLPVEFIGIEFSRLHEKVKLFDPHIALQEEKKSISFGENQNCIR